MNNRPNPSSAAASDLGADPSNVLQAALGPADLDRMARVRRCALLAVDLVATAGGEDGLLPSASPTADADPGSAPGALDHFFASVTELERVFARRAHPVSGEPTRDPAEQLAELRRVLPHEPADLALIFALRAILAPSVEAGQQELDAALYWAGRAASERPRHGCQRGGCHRPATHTAAGGDVYCAEHFADNMGPTPEGAAGNE